MSYYTIKYGETLFDVSTKLFGDASYTFDLINLNSNLSKVYEANLQGKEIFYNPIVTSGFKNVVTSDIIPLKSVTIKQGQSIFDLSLQLFGTIERVFEVVNLINTDSLDEVDSGITFSYVFENKDVPVFLNNKSFKIATGIGSNFIWDGIDRIWDGENDLIY